MNKIKRVAAAMAVGAAAFGMSAASAEPTEGVWSYCYAEHGTSGSQYSVSKLFRPMGEPGWFAAQGSEAFAGPAEAFKTAVQAEQTGRAGSTENLRVECVSDPSFYTVSDKRNERLDRRGTRVIEWPASNAILIASPATAAPLTVSASENAGHLLVYTLGEFAKGERSHEFIAPELKEGAIKADAAAARSAGAVQDFKLVRSEPDGHVFEVTHANGVRHWKVSQKNLLLTGISQASAGQ